MDKNNPNPSAAPAAGGAAAGQAADPFVTFPTRAGLTHVRASTVDAVEAIDANACHLVIDGLRLPVSVGTDSALAALTRA